MAFLNRIFDFIKRSKPDSSGSSGQVLMGFQTRITESGFSDDPYISRVVASNGKTYRDYAKWDKVETGSQGSRSMSGNANISALSAALAAGQSSGLDPILVLAYKNSLYNGIPFDATALSGFAAYAGYVATTVGSKCNTYEVWNRWASGSDGNVTTAEANRMMSPSNVQDYVDLLAAVYPAVKAANSNAKIVAGAQFDPTSRIVSTLGVNYGEFGSTAAAATDRRIKIHRGIQIGGSTATVYRNWLKAFLATDWASYSDAFSFQVFYDNGQTAQSTPEQNYQNAMDVASDVLANRNCDLHITATGYYALGGASSLTNSQIATYMSRYPFLLRCVPNVKTVIFQELIDASLQYGIYDSAGNAKAQQVTLADALAQINLATGASRHDITISTIGVKLTGTPTSGERMVLWDVIGPGTISIVVSAAGSGTLTMKTIGGGSTTTALSAGNNSVNVSITDNAKVVYADTAITFPEFV